MQDKLPNVVKNIHFWQLIARFSKLLCYLCTAFALDVYRIVEGVPVFIDYSPYNDNYRTWRFGMTDYPEFDYKNKTISCPYPEGELTWVGRTIYSVSKKQKDTVIVNGRKHYFNHMEVIEEIKFYE